VLGIDTISMSSITNTITVSTNIKCFGDPVGRDAVRAIGLKAIDVQSRGAAVGVDVAGEPGLVLWVADEEDTLDGGEHGAGELWQSVHGGGCALAVSFQDEAHIRVGSEGGLDVGDDLGGLRGCRRGDERGLTSAVPEAEFWSSPAG